MTNNSVDFVRTKALVMDFIANALGVTPIGASYLLSGPGGPLGVGVALNNAAYFGDLDINLNTALGTNFKIYTPGSGIIENSGVMNAGYNGPIILQFSYNSIIFNRFDCNAGSHTWRFQGWIVTW